MGCNLQYHYLYCTVNLLNGKVYVGKHSTNNMNDDYLGSGTLLRFAIKKYGIQNFHKYILKHFETSEEAFEFEQQIVNKEFVADENTYNVCTGGTGFGNILGVSPSDAGKLGAATNLANPEFVNRQRLIMLEVNKKFRSSIDERTRRLFAEGKLKAPNHDGSCWTGRKHKEETKRKIGSANAVQQKGEKNSQYGSMWIFNSELKISKKISKFDSELEILLSEGWEKGRKLKF